MGKHHLNANTRQNHKHLRIDKRKKKTKKGRKLKVIPPLLISVRRSMGPTGRIPLEISPRTPHTRFDRYKYHRHRLNPSSLSAAPETLATRPPFQWVRSPPPPPTPPSACAFR